MGGTGFYQVLACAKLPKYLIEDPDSVGHFAAVWITSAVGEDRRGEVLRLLKRNQIACENVIRVKDRGTSMTSILRDGDGHEAIIVGPDADKGAVEPSSTNSGHSGSDAEVLVLQPRLLPAEFIHRTTALAKSNGIPIVFVPCPSWHNVPPGVSVGMGHLIVTE
ncbi:hypothetical protein VUR80DRAFT_8089 [Thermomyces stellatus]